MCNNITAIDFETACYNSASACAVGLARVRNGKITETFYSLIKPPLGMSIIPKFTLIHGISNSDVRTAPTFEELWNDLSNFIGDDTLCAHNAPFDKGVLLSSLDYYQIPHKEYTFECTVQASRKKWKHLQNHKLNTVSDFLGIDLEHHEALSDARACAHIWIASKLK